MTSADVDGLQPGVTRVRHCDGPEGVYRGSYLTDQVWLIVDDGPNLRTWAADDCEVVR
ncbi:hypothetical protein ACFFX1_55110 [Dactylosporangium sucinum]|uniref:Uncharacterized protein n=1 Tax=Dactylosporangium sucinum TaxID=1424081 RepID=A0A917X1J2_9ACTN|nr:hypothetical protein [Dactylosporangium sucinum]GGM53054.1 hypothetical protein GCM10007977_063380 [Dactylosporangium sucinum]